MFVIELVYEVDLAQIDLATGRSREEIETIVREDPFVARGLAERAADMPKR